MQAFVDSLSNPHSKNYRHFISPAEVGKRFGPQPQTIEKVKSYLIRNGISISLVGDNGLSIIADATVRQAENAFHTAIYEYASTDGYKASGRPSLLVL